MPPLRISIVTPSFNQASFLEETILSVLNQDYPSLEYIIIDGGSTDSSEEIIKKYENKLSYWISEPDGGQSDAVNKGIRKATGDIVAWLNSDDTYTPDTLDRVNRYFQAHPDVDLVYGNSINDYGMGHEKHFRIAAFEPVRFLSRVTIPQPCVFWKRRIHDEVGYLDPALYYLMDYDLWVRIFFSFSTLKVEETFARLRIHPAAKTASNPFGQYLEYRKVLSRFFNSLNDPALTSSLKKLNIYDNKSEQRYILYNLPEEKTISAIKTVYIQQCAIQEYSIGNIRKANNLFLHSMTFSSLPKNIGFILKNNFGFGWIQRRLA